MTERPEYSRVYASIIDDPKFAHVYDDDRALAAWLRLLLVADQAWPSSAHIPSGTRRQALDILVGAELLDLGTGGRYRIRGLDAERQRRAREQRNGGVVRAESAARGPSGRFLPAVVTSTGTSTGDQPDQLRRDETRQDETSQARGSSGDPYDETVKWLASRSAWVDSPKIATELARMVDKKGAEAVIAAMSSVPNAETAAQFVYGARNALFPLPGSQTVSKEVSEAQARAQRRAELGLEALS